MIINQWIYAIDPEYGEETSIEFAFYKTTNSSIIIYSNI